MVNIVWVEWVDAWCTEEVFGDTDNGRIDKITLVVIVWKTIEPVIHGNANSSIDGAVTTLILSTVFN